MKGQYTEEEIKELPGRIISSVKQYWNGLIIIQVSKTVNYYCKHKDGSWTNYDCKTLM